MNISSEMVFDPKLNTYRPKEQNEDMEKLGYKYNIFLIYNKYKEAGN